MHVDRARLGGNGRRGKSLAARGESWFWHVLALALGGRSVAEWRDTITAEEFAAWVAFYRLHPFDDHHRYYRPAALVARSMTGEKLDDLLEWLDRPITPPPSRYSAADLETMRAFGMKPPENH